MSLDRPTCVTRCLACSKRLHASSEYMLQRQKARHARNCNVLRRRLTLAEPTPKPDGGA